MLNPWPPTVVIVQATSNHCFFSGHDTFLLCFSHKFQIWGLVFYLMLLSHTTQPITHSFHHDIILCQYSLGHQCSHPSAIIATFWSLVMLFLGLCSRHLPTFIHRRSLLPSSTLCTTHFTLFFFYSTSNLVIHCHHSRYIHKLTFQT